MEKDVRDKMQATLDHLHEELQTVRTSRANSAMVENINVTYYDQQMPIKALANITTPDATTITIMPWDPNATGPIEKALQEDDNLGLSPVSDGKTIYINVPPLTSEGREQLIKQVRGIAENAHISLRNIRHEALKQQQNQLKEKQVSEDEFEAAKKRLDELVQEFGEQVEETATNKKQDIQTV